MDRWKWIPPEAWMRAINKYRNLLAVTVVPLLLLASWVGIYFIVGNTDIANNTKAAWIAAVSLFVNLASTVFAFLIVSLLFRKEDAVEQQSVLRRIVSEEIGRPNFLSQVPWGDLIDNASEIDFIVQGWDGWADQQNTSRALASFFERGGHFSLYVYNADSDEASQARALMAQRLGRAPGEVLAEIIGTFRRINETREHVPGGKIDTSKLELIQTNNLNWYFAAFFKGRELAGQARARDVMVFSIYSHTPRRPWNMPAIVVYPDVQHKTARMVQS